MFVLAVNDIADLKTLAPSNLFDGMPVSALVNGSNELYIWWEGVTETDDNHLIVRLNSPNNGLGAFKKVFNRFVSSASVPLANPIANEVGTYWLDSSMLSVYLAASFVVDGAKQYKWVQLVNNVGGK